MGLYFPLSDPQLLGICIIFVLQFVHPGYGWGLWEQALGKAWWVIGRTPWTPRHQTMQLWEIPAIMRLPWPPPAIHMHFLSSGRMIAHGVRNAVFLHRTCHQPFATCHSFPHPQDPILSILSYSWTISPYSLFFYYLPTHHFV